MTLNTSGKWEDSPINPVLQCGHNMTGWNQQMEKMYTYFYLLLFIPGLLLNTTALWVLCRHISKRTKAVIFMINLAVADLAHILSLPLRIYYYFTHSWPFGKGVCLVCFYLKYLNMYAAIVFLVCISMQRCVFLLKPFTARRWRRRYDLLISVIVWVVVSLACSPFILMRSSSTNLSIDVQTGYNMSSLDATSTQQPLRYTRLYAPPFSTNPSRFKPVYNPSSTKVGCFKDLPMRRLSASTAVTMTALAELFGFVIPLACIGYSSIRIARSLKQTQIQDQHHPNSLKSSTRSRLQSVTSDGHTEKEADSEKRRALRMVLSCSTLFLLCFAPYHLNFLLYMMVSQGIVSHCATRLAVLQFHPVSLCLASSSCCLNPLLYYFLTAEFRLHLRRRSSSFTSSFLSSPISSPTQLQPQHRLVSTGGGWTDREERSGLLISTLLVLLELNSPRLEMDSGNQSCGSSEDLRMYQHHVYAVVYSVILAPGLLGNVLALWVFRIYIRETKKAVVFMMNLAVADLLQVLSLPLRIYYYLNNTWPFGHPLCMICFYLKYVNMYASIYFLVCVSVRRCELIIRPLTFNSSRRRDLLICALGWLLVILCCLPFPLLRNSSNDLSPSARSLSSEVRAPLTVTDSVCFSELSMRTISLPAAGILLIVAELLGFVIPFILVASCACLTAGSLRQQRSGAIPDQGEKQKALRMVLSCAALFLLCFAPYHITMPLDFLVKANVLSSCALRDRILRSHPVTLCLASLNCSLDPLMYYFTTYEFWKRLNKPDRLEGIPLSRQLTCLPVAEDQDNLHRCQ
ncbi:uncharacterized protein [Antennarius striatus]|uniref:uncharacterized protein n=1 Tax=Antennarius striatus TaxID=241820 RepID=UPI0035ADC947